MAYFKLSDLVAIDEIKTMIEVDAKPLQKMAKEEDSVSLFWETVFSGDQQEDFNSDEYSENSRSYWDETLDYLD